MALLFWDGFPRIDLALKAATSMGTKDLCVPNEKHWGTARANIVITKYISDSTPKLILSASLCGRLKFQAFDRIYQYLYRQGRAPTGDLGKFTRTKPLWRKPSITNESPTPYQQ